MSGSLHILGVEDHGERRQSTVIWTALANSRHSRLLGDERAELRGLVSDGSMPSRVSLAASPSDRTASLTAAAKRSIVPTVTLRESQHDQENRA
jgi:hypothetical protein